MLCNMLLVLVPIPTQYLVERYLDLIEKSESERMRACHQTRA